VLDLTKRPTFILAFPGDAQGCGSHRVIFPLGALASVGLTDGRIDMQPWSADQFAACNPDVIVWQRPVEDGQFALMETARKACPDAFFVYELDDRLDAVPDSSYHSGFIPQKHIGERVARGLDMCDAVTTTTQTMAAWLTEVHQRHYPGGRTLDIRVIPNLLPASKLREHEFKHTAKLRVGWGGGISHAGDLSLLHEAMTLIGNKVEWVFLAMKPKNIPQGVHVEFHDGVPPMQYLDTLAGLNLDLVLAPIEDNAFNRCKSNLRLVEAGAIGACVIASHVTPYTENAPPVFQYAAKPVDWVSAINAFMNLSASERAKNARKLQTWVAKHYTFESQMAARFAAWLPPNSHETAFRPGVAKPQTDNVVIMVPGGASTVQLPHALHRAPVETTMDAAVARARTCGTDLLVLRPGTTLLPEAWERLRAAMLQAPQVAGVLPLACDGPNAFPHPNGFTPMPEDTIRQLQDVVARHFPHRYLHTPILSGPCVLLNRNALAMLGTPDERAGSDEAAVLEWGLRALPRGWRFLQAADAFVGSVAPPPQATPTFATRLQSRAMAGLPAQAMSETLTPAERERMELDLLRAAWNGVRPGMMGFGNDYMTWTQMIGDRPNTPYAPSVVDLAPYGALLTRSEWTIYFEPGTRLKPGAMTVFENACAKAGPDVAVIYADHDVAVENGQLWPEFKPDFDFTRLLARDYVTPIMAVRTAAVAKAPADRFALYAMVLMFGLRGRTAFQHIPHVLATVDAQSPEEAALATRQRHVVLDDFFPDGSVEIEASKIMLGALNVRHRWQHYRDEAPLVSVIVPTKGAAWMLQPCINTLLKLTDYPNFEVIVMHNGDTDAPELGDALDDPRVRWIAWKEPYNWSKLNNDAMMFARGEIVCFMNDDVRIVQPEWMTRMVGQTLRPGVGVVGARLIFPTGQIQHVGVICHKGIAGHVLKGAPPNAINYGGIAHIAHEAVAVTGAVMMCRREIHEMVAGFDTTLAHNYNDVVFCLELDKIGLSSVVETSAELMHMEGATRVSPLTQQGFETLVRDNATLVQRYPEADRFWNPNYALVLTNGGLMIQGLNADVLAWQDTPPAPGAKRVLLVNDKPGMEGAALTLHRQGFVPMMADLSGFALRLTAPQPANVPAWDIRDTRVMSEALRTLGVDVVVLRSLVGAQGAAPPVEALRGFAALDIEVQVHPIEPKVIAPWLDMDEGTPSVSTTFGLIDRGSWRAAYEDLTSRNTPTALMMFYDTLQAALDNVPRAA
jgi:GT2 family glycosyltransferase